MNPSSQTKAILALLQSGDSITHKEAERMFACTRIAARIKDIRDGKADGRKYGKDLLTVTIEPNGNGGRHARYRLLTPRLKIIQDIAPFPPKPFEKPNLFTQ